MEENKKSKKGLVLGIIAVLIILGLVGYICYDKGLIFKSNKEVVKKEKKIVEKEITNKELKEDLDKKIAYLNTNDSWNTKPLDNPVTFSAYNFRNNIFKGINKQDKHLIALESFSIGSDYKKVTQDIKSKLTIEEETKNILDNGDHYIEESLVQKRYKELFGEETDFSKYNSSFGKCPMFYYDSTNKLFIRLDRCGGTSAGIVGIYKNKYTKKGDNAYVYTNYYYIAPQGTGDKFAVYKDAVTNIKEETTTEKYSDNSDDFDIKKEYKEFPEYKYTFKKDKDGNYYFVSVKQTK